MSIVVVDYAKERRLDKATVRQLAGGRWIEAHHNVVITSATGVGKTYLACALAQQAGRLGYRVLYRSARAVVRRADPGAHRQHVPAAAGPLRTHGCARAR